MSTEPERIAAAVAEAERLAEHRNELSRVIARLEEEIDRVMWERDDARSEVERLAGKVARVEAAWEPYTDDDMGSVPWRLQRDMRAALADQSGGQP